MIDGTPTIRAESHVLPFGGLVPFGLPPPPIDLIRALPLPTPDVLSPRWPAHCALALPPPGQLLTPIAPLPTFATILLGPPPADSHPDLTPTATWPPQPAPATPNPALTTSYAGAAPNSTQTTSNTRPAGVNQSAVTSQEEAREQHYQQYQQNEDGTVYDSPPPVLALGVATLPLYVP